MTLPEETIIRDSVPDHQDAHESLHAIHNQNFSILDPQYYATGQQPGNGNATHDMTAITNMLADIMSGTPSANKKQKVAHFPGGRGFRLNGSGIAWPNGVWLIGGGGSDSGVGRSTTFLWDGTAGGTEFTFTDTGGRIANTLVQDIIIREGTARPGKWVELGDATIPVGVDFGTMFRRIQFSNADAPSGGGCFDIKFGPTNFWMDHYRMDNWSGAAHRVAVNNAASHVSFTRGTMDNGTSAGGYPFWFDNTAMGSNKNVFVYIGDWKVEVNVALTGEKTLILCSIDHLSTATVQHHIHLEDFHVVPGGGISTDYSIVKAKRTDATDTRNISVHAFKSAISADRLIDGVIDPGSYGSFVGRKPNWSYTPQGFGHATPGGEGVLEDHQTQARFRDLYVGNGSYSDLAGTSGGRGVMRLHNALAVPSANPVGGGILYVEGGALKYRGTSGTVTTIANA